MTFSNRITRISLIAVLSLVIFILAIGTLAQRSKPDLSLWHIVNLKSEFEADDARGDF